MRSPASSSISAPSISTWLRILLCAGAHNASASSLFGAAPQPPQGNASAVLELIDRVLPGARAHFRLSINASACSSTAGCFVLEDNLDGTVTVTGSTASDISAGVGAYLMDYANQTIGWPRGGGQNLFIPQRWPTLGQKVTKQRSTPWSYIMNVCTHSYSLVWYSWAEWEAFIDWQALWGINLNLAMTGQEEVQWKVFTQLGLNDTEIRGWFNGPALLTWSRGQNEYGAGIAGPLPRSWMKNQWHLQKQILTRYRQLGIVGQLPGFQGNVPVGIKALKQDANISVQGATGWIDSLDPLYAEVADLWMKILVEDFGTDHWYQLDGYLNGGTAPWMDARSQHNARAANALPQSLLSATLPSPVFAQKRRVPISADPAWKARGVAAYTGLNRTDPDAVWSFQGFAFVGWSTDEKAAWLKGFVDAVPESHFNIIDMGYSGRGEWHKWNDSSFFGTKFVWTALMNFGGTNGIKGNLTHMNEIPYKALAANTSIWGSGMTSEGIDQNPAIYDFLNAQNWRDRPVPSIPDYLVARAHRRYGLSSPSEDVTNAWELLSKYKSSMYQQDVSVQDFTGVHNFPGGSNWDWVGAGCHGGCTAATPADTLCKTFQAWEAMVSAATKVGTKAMTEPMRYDLIDLGRDVLARLTTPISQNFSASLGNGTTTSPDASECERSGKLYVDLLMDLNALVGTDQAFLLGSWEKMARQFAADGSEDCTPPNHPEVASCADFYVWNARTQLTTWAGGYAGKHWNGLLKDWYAERISRLMKAGLAAAAADKPLSKMAISQLEDALATEFKTAFQVRYAEAPTADPVSVSQEMLTKYSGHFESCGATID